MPKINATEDLKLSPKKAKTKLPSMYKVIILNDDFTPMEFVVNTIQRFFNKSVDEATRIMLKIHTEGLGVCGIFPVDLYTSDAADDLKRVEPWWSQSC